MQKTKSTFRKAKAGEKSEKTSSFSTRVGLRLGLKSACATGVGFDALEGATKVDLCIWAMDFRPKVRVPP
jgi:hypothetical protein